MKWHHDFNLKAKEKSYRVYEDEKNVVRIDFFEHMLRVAIYKKDAYLFNTFSISPGTYQMPLFGRERLSQDGFNLVEVDEEIKIDDIDIKINLHNFSISYYKGQELLFCDREELAYNLDGEYGNGTYHYLCKQEDEHIYGLGDKTGKINKNNQCFKMETFDAMGFDANTSDPLYKQIPFFICTNNVGSYGIFYDTYANGEIDFGKEINNYYKRYKKIHFEDDVLVYYVIFGDVKQIVSRFMYLTGKAMLPPEWYFHYAASTMAYTDAQDANDQLNNFLDLIKKYNIDCKGFYLSSGYTQIKDRRYVFHWNKDKIPNPKALANKFKEEGINFLPNVKPAFLTDHPLYDYIASRGWFLHYKDGKAATFPFWGGEASLFDFTNEDAFNFWTECVKKNLVDLGYQSIWNDNNEYDIHDEDIYANGFGHQIKAKLIRPLFSYLMSFASLKANDDISPLSISRSGIAGMERVATTWTGDNKTSFVDFRGNHKMAMSMSLTGFRFFGQDIGGFAGDKPNKELFIRWIQYGLFMPRFVLHSWNSDGSSNMPWLYLDIMDVVCKLFDFRQKIIPYLYSEAKKAVDEYKPLIYPLFLVYPEYDEESDAYMCGDSILVKPIFEEGVAKTIVNLPEEKEGWYLEDKIVFDKVEINTPLDDVCPYFVKAGSIIPMADGLHLYPLKKGKFIYNYYNDIDGNLEIAVECKEDEINITLDKENHLINHDYNKRKINVVLKR